jgi:transcriptional regulator with XRE-family HTH domain
MKSLLTRILEHEVKERGISQRQVAREIGVSLTTILAVMKERPMDLHTAKAVCDWVGAPLSILSDRPAEWKAALVIYTLNTHPDLRKRWAEQEKVSFRDILSPENVRVLMSFVEFRQDMDDHGSSPGPL